MTCTHSHIDTPSVLNLSFFCFVSSFSYWLKIRVVKRAGAMPFLHGFRRIIYEYQPLVDAVMSVVGLEEVDGGHNRR